MIYTQKQAEASDLVNWTYSKEEWRTFMRWKKMKKGIVYYLFHRLIPGRVSKTPSVTITSGKICINDVHTTFCDTERQLKYINIRDAGKINVMEICYESKHAHNTVLNEIHIPVPKGRLKEAIGVEQKLNAIRMAIPPG